MTKQISTFVMWVACLALILAWTANTGRAADKRDYSGRYSLQGKKSASGNGTVSALDVVQEEDSIEVTKVEQGKRMTTRYPLGGSDGDYTSPGGVSGKCRAQFKGKYLVLESMVVTRPLPNSPAARVHTRERWQLSTDSKTLTIRSDVDFPDAPPDVSAAVSASGVEKYTRLGDQ